MDYIGDYNVDATVRIPFTTNDGSGGTVAPSTSFEAADVQIYKNGSDTPRASEVGYTMTSPVNSVTGLHRLEVDTSNNTDPGFFEAGADYFVVLNPSDETIDGQTVVAVIGYFSIENRSSSMHKTLTEGYAAANTAMSAAEALHYLVQFTRERGVVGDLETIRKIDGVTPAVTNTLNDATYPTDRSATT